MKLFKTIAGITVIFALGVMSGVLGTSLVIKHRIETFHKKGPPPVRAMFMERISDRLNLNPAQKESVGKILDNLQVELKDIRHEVRPKIKEAFDKSFQQIREQLTDPQKKELDQFLKELPEDFPRMKHFRHHEWREKERKTPNQMGKKSFDSDPKNL